MNRFEAQPLAACRYILYRALLALGTMTSLAIAGPAMAYTQCQSGVEKMWAGDGGYIWIHLTNGGSAMIAPSDPNREAVTAMTITALTASRQVIIRYAADNVACNSQNRSDFLGMYLL